MALKKTCTCGKLIDYGQSYCNECQAKWTQERAEKNRYYDKHVRNREAADFYNSGEWEAARAEAMRRCKGLDIYEYYVNRQITYADTVHHVVELSDDWGQRLDIGNLIPLSQRIQGNHSMIHKMYLQNKKETQTTLFGLLKRWEAEFGGGGGTKKV